MQMHNYTALVYLTTALCSGRRELTRETPDQREQLWIPERDRDTEQTTWHANVIHYTFTACRAYNVHTHTHAKYIRCKLQRRIGNANCVPGLPPPMHAASM